MWRAGSDSLPSKSNLKKRKIPIDATCSSCGLEPETSFHAIWSCPSLVQVWKVHFGWLVKAAGMAASFFDVLQLCSEKSNLVDLFVMIVSQIWTRRNKLRVGKGAAPLDMINQLASASLQLEKGVTPSYNQKDKLAHIQFIGLPFYKLMLYLKREFLGAADMIRLLHAAKGKRLFPPLLPKTTIISDVDSPDECSDVLIVSDSMAVAAHYDEDANVALVGHTYLIKGMLSNELSFIAYTYAGEPPSCSFGFNSHGLVKAFSFNKNLNETDG
nr:hypothetical protein CFP56_32633 [Quercus suber]